MGLTPNSGTVPYCSAAQFLARVDNNLVGELVTDLPPALTSGVQPPQYPTSTQLLTNPSVLTALADASGLIESQALIGARYAPSDLLNLTGNSASFLQRICADIALYYLWNRRDGQNPPTLVSQRYDQSLAHLDRLAAGEAIFAFVETEQAGLPSSEFVTQAAIAGLPRVTNVYRMWGTRMSTRQLQGAAGTNIFYPYYYGAS